MAKQTILITGVSGQIGDYLADQFFGEDSVVCGLDLKPPRELLQRHIFFQSCDLADGAETEHAIGRFHREHGAFDVVLNCAGLIANAPLISFVDGRLTHHDFDLWDRVISSCLTSAFNVTASTAPEMVSSRKNSVIINISSICSRGNKGQAAYSAAKGGLNSLSFALAKELGSFGIRVVAVAPGYFDTASTHENVSTEHLRQITSSVPLRRLGKLDELWSTVKFVITNKYVTGTVIELDGGLTL